MPQLKPIASKGRGLQRAHRTIGLILPKKLQDPEVKANRKSLARIIGMERKTRGEKAGKRFYMKYAATQHRYLKSTVKDFPGNVHSRAYAPTKN